MDPTKIISIGSQVLPVAKSAIDHLTSATDAFARELLGVGDRQVEKTGPSNEPSNPVSFQLQYQQAVEQIRGVLQNAAITDGTTVDLEVTESGKVVVHQPKELSQQIADVINNNDGLVDNLDSLRQKHEDFLWRHPGPASFQSPLLRNAANQGFRIPVEI